MSGSDQQYWHLSGGKLGIGTIIEPGNYGRIIRTIGWRHDQALREMALENARLNEFPNRPSRLDAAFVFISREEAERFKGQINGFLFHIIYRVTLVDPSASSHITDHRFCAPSGTLRPDWARLYWLDPETQAAAVPGINWTEATGGVRLLEMLTLSQLLVEERLD